MAGFKVRYLMKGIRPILPFLFLIGIIQFFFISRDVQGDPLFAAGFFKIYREDLLFTARLFARFFCLVLLLSLFTSVTPVTEISHGTEAFLRPFSRTGALAHDMSLVVTITFRFIPILVQEAEHITKAQASRGGEFGTWKTGLLKRIRLFFPLIIPLFISALERAEVLVEAMESRCYEPGARRTRLDEFHWTREDRITLVLVVSVCILLIASRFI
jgi:energy-coupling factor transport system permease protein